MGKKPKNRTFAIRKEVFFFLVTIERRADCVGESNIVVGGKIRDEKVETANTLMSLMKM